MSMSMSMFDEIIDNQKLKVWTKTISIHSEDRDVSKYKDASKFTVHIPDPIKNVTSIRVKDVILPKHFSYSDKYHNTNIGIDISNQTTEWITIENGYYNTTSMIEQLKLKINNYFATAAKDVSFTLYENAFDNRLHFVVSGDKPTDCSFHLQFQDSSSNSNHLDLNAFWGLGYHLGFEKKYDNSGNIEKKSSKKLVVGTDKILYNDKYDNNKLKFLNPNNINIVSHANLHLITSDFMHKIYGKRAIYMELDGFNSIDEIDPISARAQFYKPNSSIAKLQLSILNTEEDDTRIEQDFLSNKTVFKTPIERLDRCSFQFRFHDGTLVDFAGNELSFSLEIEYIE